MAGALGPRADRALPALRVVAEAGRQGRQPLQRPPGRRAPLGRHASPRRRRRRRASGITKAKKRYTDQRKIKMAAMRSLKAKRVREFAARTKKMPKKKRDQARREYKAKADARYKEMVTKFPPARGLRDMQSVLGLIAKLDTVRMAQ